MAGIFSMKKRNLTEGSILRYLFSLGIPVTLGFMMNYLYVIVDTYWVGRLGQHAIAAISYAGTFFFVIFAVAQICSTGALALVAREFGRGNEASGNSIAHNAAFISLILGVAISALVLVFCHPLSAFLGARGEALELTSAFMRTFAPGILADMFLITMSFALRGAGDVIHALIMMVIGNIFNLFLDPALIFGWGPFPQLGIAGSGLANTISKVFSVAYCVYALTSGKSRIKIPLLSRFAPDWKTIAMMLRIGLPGGIQFFVLSASTVVLLRLASSYGEYGTAVVAALGLTMRIMQITTIPVMGLGSAVSAIVGQNLGANKPQRAILSFRLGLIISLSVSAVFAFLFFTFPGFFIALFLKTETVSEAAQMMAIGTKAMHILSLSQLLIVVVIIYQSVFSGSGDTMPNMLCAIVRAAVLVIVAAILPKYTGIGLDGIWYSLPASNVFGLAILAFFYSRGKWKTRLDRFDKDTLPEAGPSV